MQNRNYHTAFHKIKGITTSYLRQVLSVVYRGLWGWGLDCWGSAPESPWSIRNVVFALKNAPNTLDRDSFKCRPFENSACETRTPAIREMQKDPLSSSRVVRITTLTSAINYERKNRRPLQCRKQATLLAQKCQRLDNSHGVAKLFKTGRGPEALSEVRSPITGH